MDLSLSTSWNSFRHTRGEEIIQEIKNLGFLEIELSFDLTRGIVNDIYSCLKKNKIKVNSIHNYCPIPSGLKRFQALPDCYSLASLDEKERALALKYTKLTIKTAFKLGAKAVVLHCGRVETKDYTREIISLYDKGKIESEEFSVLKEKMNKERQEKSHTHLSKAIESLKELSEYARPFDIGLGVENRFYFREIPSFEEIGEILNYFRTFEESSNIFYWHDSGHAQLWENLGFSKHKDYLEAYQSRLLGVHLHDIRGGSDHLAPLKGDFDFKLLKPYLKADTLKTLEAHHPATAEQIIAAKDFLTKIYGPN